ncbi:MAG: SH3 domain-containing protein [Ruthenibacterium sp.]
MKKILKKALAICLTMTLVLSITACDSQITQVPVAVGAGLFDSFGQQTNEIAGTVIGATMNNICIRTEDGTELIFATVDAKVESVDGILEGDWVCIDYIGSIVAGDTAGTQVVKIIDNDAHVETATGKVVMTPTSKVMYSTGPLHVRDNYNDHANIIATLLKNDKVTVTATSNSGWDEINFNGGKAYVFGKYLTDKPFNDPLSNAQVDQATPVDAIVYAKVNLRMRDSASLGSNVLGVVKKGTAIHEIGNIGGMWAQVEYDGGVAYCDDEYLSSQALPETPESMIPTKNGLPAGVNKIPEDSTMYTTVALRMHAACSTDATVIGTAPKGSAIHVTGILDNHFSEVQYGGRTAYCVTQYLSKDAPAQQTQSTSFASNGDEVFTVSSLHVRQNPSLGGKILKTVPAGYEFARTGISRDGMWSRVSYNGGDAYCATQYLSTVRPSTMNAPYTAGSGNDGNGSGVISYGTPVYLDGNVITTAALRMHIGADLSAQVLGTVPAGTRLQRSAKFDNGWSRVEYNGMDAYCSSAYLKVA